jgi:arylsulfatase A-like enzyme
MFKKSSRREFLRSLGVGAAIAAFPGLPRAQALNAPPRKRPPNVVLIFCDDLGYGDLGCYGSAIASTPNLDRMSAEGLRLTDFYVSQAVCSASRASLLTGCYAERVGIQGALGPGSAIGLSPEEETIADLLKARGYATAIFGKWHLGHFPEFLPLRHGFDEYYGLPYSNDMWPVDYGGHPVEKGPRCLYPFPPLIENDRKVGEVRTLEDQNKLTSAYTERALEFIERNRTRPFFLYLAHSMPHVPLGVSDRLRGKSRGGLYGDVVMEIDWSAGEIFRALARLGIENDTLVIFTSDNGPWLNFGNHGGSAGPLREGKGTMWEGGARVPCLMRWPGRIKGGTVCQTIAATIDILPTVVDLAGASRPQKTIDGVSLLPILDGDIHARPRDHFFYYYGRELRAVRQGRSKLMLPHKSQSYEGQQPGKDGFPGPTVTRDVPESLFDLETDIGERTSVITDHPEVAMKLRALAREAREELGDALRDVKGSGTREPARAGASQTEPMYHLGRGHWVVLGTSYSPKYAGSGESTLVDGWRGSLDHTDGRWLGFEGTDFEAAIDLGIARKLKSIAAGFLSAEASWIFLPVKVEIAVSIDGREYEVVRTFSEEIVRDANPAVKDYAAELGGRTARFVRVRAESIKTCPDWHPGAGREAWLFIDEITIISE